MQTVGIDNGPANITVIDYPGDDFAVTVWLLDVTSGPLAWSGATIGATVDGVAMAKDTSVAGRLVLTLTAAQTTSIGAKSAQFLLSVTPAGGTKQTYIDGVVTFRNGGASLDSTGYDVGFVNNVAVLVIGD